VSLLYQGTEGRTHGPGGLVDNTDKEPGYWGYMNGEKEDEEEKSESDEEGDCWSEGGKDMLGQMGDGMRKESVRRRNG